MSTKSFDKENSYCLSVGIGKREEDSDAMAISADDAKYLQRALYALDLFSEEKITALLNATATRSAIIKNLNLLAKNTKKKPADLVIIFFSGHGAVIDEKYWLICNDTRRENMEATAINGAVFVKKLKAIQCDKLLVLLDCCHAEGMTDIPFDKKLILNQPNRVILTACSKDQLSYLSSPVSIFTYATIEALGGKFLNGKDDKEVNIFSLAMDVRERVVALSEQVIKPDKIQKPQLNVLQESSTTNFVLARYPLGGPQEINIFRQQFSTLKSYEGKDLEMDVKNKKDIGERNKFDWLVTNSIINKGDGNFIVQGSTINNGLSESALKDILDRFQEKDKIIENLTALLQTQADPASKGLLVKIETLALYNTKEKKNLEEQLNLLSEKKAHFELKKILNTDAGTEFYLMKEIEKIETGINRIKTALHQL